MSRRRHAILASVALGLACTAASAPPSGATAAFGLPRLAGADRYATAAAVALATFSSSTDALLASGENFPDALAGNYLAGEQSAPVLLARRTGVPAPTMAALDELGVQRVTLLGGEGALGQAVVAALTGAGITVERIAGADRFETAAAIAREGGAPSSGIALLASGRSFPDALAAGPLAYGSGLPQLLTEPGSLHPATASAIADLGIETVVILGGSAAVSPAIATQLAASGLQVGRLAGADRYATSVAIAEWAIAELGHRTDHVDIATGANFPDALAGGAHAGEQKATILLAEPFPADGAAARYLAAHAAQVTGGHAFGGAGAVSDAALGLLVAAGSGTPALDQVAACESTLFQLINDERTSQGLVAYLFSPSALPIARSWSQHMAATQTLAHNPQIGAQLEAAGIAWQEWGENISFGATVSQIHARFMTSADHRGNILDDFTHAAVGCAVDAGGQLWATEVFYRL